MRIQIPKHATPKSLRRIKKKLRVRKKVIGSAERPRLSIYRSTRNIFAQLIDDTAGKTLVSVSSFKLDTAANKDSAIKLGQEIAQAALKNNISQVVFDRNGYIYHGRVKAFADAAREAGLKF